MPLMSDDERRKLLELQKQLEVPLMQIKRMLPPQFRLTLICRNVDFEQGQLILTEDDDIEAAAEALLRGNRV
jgi:hypothetical protein